MGADVAVAVVAVARTAVRPVDGELAGWNPVELAGVVGREALERAGLDAGDLDEVVVGCADPVGACGADAARAIVLAARWPVSISGHVIDRGETSGLAAVQAAVASIRAGQARTVLVLGLGLCSVVPPGAAALNRTYGAPWGGVAERFAETGGLLPGPRLAERAVSAAGIGRDELDAAADESRRRRAAAGEPSPAIVAVAARPGDAAARGVYPGDPVAADIVRSWGETAALPPAFDDEGLLTAATFAPPADAVAAVLLQAVSQPGPSDSPVAEAAAAPQGPGSARRAQAADAQARRGGPPAGTAAVLGSSAAAAEADGSAVLATVAGTGRAAGDPFDPAGDVAVAVSQALAGAGVGLDAVDDIAVVEHDAATVGLVARALAVDESSINRHGGAVATGNAAAAEELRLITDGLSGESGAGGGLLLTISAGPTGSAALVWRTDI